MIEIGGIILAKAAEAFLQSFVGKVTDELYKKIVGDPAISVYKKALAIAIKRYSTGERLFFSQALVKENSILQDKDVAEEISHLIRFEREPNLKLIAKRWKEALKSSISLDNFVEEAILFISYLKNELQVTDTYGPVFEAKSLIAISKNTSSSSQSLINIESSLSSLIGLIDGRFTELNTIFSTASINIREQILDFTRLIEEKTQKFVGRQFVFDAVNNFIQDNPRGYFFIKGDPGIGKSAIAAQLVKQNGYVHHFNVRAEGIYKASDFLRNICSQLIAVYDLPYSFLPQEITQDAAFLNKLLNKVSEKINNGKCIIVIDALDEVDTTSITLGTNILYLPLVLPKGIYFIATSRKSFLPLRIDCEQKTIYIEHDSINNIADIKKYIKAQILRLSMQSYIKSQNISADLFVNILIEKCQGNFIYLHYVLPELESGAYKTLAIEIIPTGLQNYYEDHWRRIRGENETNWFNYKLPVLVALTVIKEPISIAQIREFSNVDDISRIRSVINEWKQFLHEEFNENNKNYIYRLYHASFFDFIASKQDIIDERIDLKSAHKQISDTMWKSIFDD